MTTYMIIENRDLMDGELLDRDRLFRALPYADTGARVLAFDMDKALSGASTQLRDCTEDMVLEADAAGAFVGLEERCRDMLAGDYISFPLSKAEIEATEADHYYDLMHEGVL